MLTLSLPSSDETMVELGFYLTDLRDTRTITKTAVKCESSTVKRRRVSERNTRARDDGSCKPLLTNLPLLISPSFVPLCRISLKMH